MYVRYISVGLDGHLWNCPMGNVLVFKKKTLLVFVYLTKCRVSFENKKIIKGCHNPTWLCKFFLHSTDSLGAVFIPVIDWTLKKFKTHFIKCRRLIGKENNYWVRLALEHVWGANIDTLNPLTGGSSIWSWCLINIFESSRVLVKLPFI